MQLHSGTECLNFGQSLISLPYFVYVRSDGSGSTEIWLLADVICTQISCTGPPVLFKFVSLYFSLRLSQQLFSYVGTGLPGLNQY